MKSSRFAALLLALATLSLPAQKSPRTTPTPPLNGYQTTWWKEAVVYQIYPRSFKDSNGDGIGDLPGITSKLDYLQHLGVDVIWLSPHFDSPNADNGYDIRDYEKVMTEFGTMADFDRILRGIKQRHMRLIIDLVVNHTSDEHRWFTESRKSKDNPFRDYYIWRDGKPNVISTEAHSAQQRDPCISPSSEASTKPGASLIAPSAMSGSTSPTLDHVILNAVKDPCISPSSTAASTTSLPPNNYPSYFSGSAWQFDPTTSQFYLHYFAVKQPDLNWDNPKVRKEVYSLMRFWLDKGVDGFRMDVIPLISKPAGFPDLTAEQLRNPSNTFANGPNMHTYLQEMNREALAPYDTMTVGEAIGTSLAQTSAIVDERHHELNMIFNFDAVSLPGGEHRYTGYKLPDLKHIFDTHAEALDKHSWDTVFLSNHDNPRLVSSFGPDNPALRIPAAKLLETMLLTLRGTPFLYQGDELGMTNFPFTDISQFDDIAVKNFYKMMVLTGQVPEAAFIANLRRTGRDNARTPMQWDSSAHGGFTSAPKAWLAENPNYKEINATAELSDPQSILNYTRAAIALRHAHKAFVYGDYRDLDPTNPTIYSYTRTLDAGSGGPEQYLVVLNFSDAASTYTLPADIKPATLVLSNLNTHELGTDTLHLAPWESRVYKLAPTKTLSANP